MGPLFSLRSVSSLQARPGVFSWFQESLRDYEGDPRTVQCVFNSIPFSLSAHSVQLVIFAFLILFATFIVGLRCFGDFDKGLKPSKVHGQSLLPTQTAEKINLMGEYSSF